MKKDKHVLVDESTRRELKVLSAKKGISIGDFIRELLNKRKEDNHGDKINGK